MIYRIKDWDSAFEVSDSRKVGGPLKWVPIRTATDGLGFGRIAAEKNPCELLAAWHLIVAIAGKQNREERGKLARNGRALTPDDLELMTRFPASVFERAIAYFASPRMGWLVPDAQSVDPATHPDASGSIRTTPDALPVHPDASGDAPTTGQDRTGQDNKGAASPTLPFSSEAFAEAWALFRKHRTEIRKPLKPTAEAMALKWCANIGERAAIVAIEHTVRKGWQGLREPDASEPQPRAGSAKPAAPAEPDYWREMMNDEFPGSAYARGGMNEGTPWQSLDAATRALVLANLPRWLSRTGRKH